MSDQFADVPLFAGVAPGAQRALLDAARPVRLAAGERLFRRGDPPGPMSIVMTGRLVALDDDTGTVMRTMGRGAVVGELSVITGEPRSATVVAQRDSGLLSIPESAVADVLAAEPSFGLALLRSVSVRLRTGHDPAGGAVAQPVTIAVVAEDDGASLEATATLLRAELATTGPVERVDPARGEDLAATAERIDRLEYAGLRVLLVARTADAAWAVFCLRQADAVVTVAGAELLLGHGLLAPRAVLPGPAHRPEDRVAVLARRLAGRSVGVVLSGGGARGFAHIGALEALLDAGVEIDRVGGCSSGALIGGLFAAGLSPDEIAARCRSELVDRNPLRDYTIPLVSLIRGKDVRDMLVRLFGEQRIETLPRDYFCVSVDLVASRLVVHRAGLMHRAVGASMSLPGIGPPVVDGDTLLVDGGVLDNLPVATMAGTGEGPVVAIDVSAPFEASDAAAPHAGRPRANALRARLRAAVVGDAGGEHLRQPSLRETLMRTVTLGASDEAAAAAEHAALVIRPPVREVGLFAFARLDELRDRGRTAAEQALAEHPDWAA